MKKKLLLGLLLVGISGLMATILFGVSHTVFAQGAGGTGGNSGNCTGSGPCYIYGYGWYKYDVNGNGPARWRDNSQTWASASAQCRDTGNDSLIAFVYQTPSYSPYSAWVYNYAWESQGIVGGNWLDNGYVQWLYAQTGQKYGTYGDNLGWFCYNFANHWSINGQSYIQKVSSASVGPNTSLHVSGNVGNVLPGNRLYWWHDLRNNGPDKMDKQLSVAIGMSGFSNGWSPGKWQGWVSPANSGVLFYRDYPTGGPYSVYDVTQNDVGNTLCENVQWQWAAWNNSGVGQSTPRCATVPYNYALSPTITNITNDTTVEGGSGTVPINGLVTNNGPTKSQINIQWQITKLVYNPGVAIANTGGGVSASNPCGYFSGNTTCTALSSGTEGGGYSYPGSKPYNSTDTIGDAPVGTHLCYAMSVKRNSSSSPDWRHSQLYCFIVGKKPKVEVLGSDLVVGTPTSGSAALPTPSDAVTSSTIKTVAGTQKQYGSWVEYGMFVTGNVKGIASAAGYAGGVNPGSLCSFSLLTFANQYNGSCSDTQIGKFTLTGTSPQVASRFPVISTTPKISGNVNLDSLASKTTYTSNGAADINLSAGSAIPAGKWVVINAPNAKVTITSNITYTTATLHSLSDIPQLVIIAKNIVIADSVNQVDSWLVAVGADTGSGASAVENGILNTCAIGGSDVTTLPNANQCNQPLRVNGPVIVNHLLMRRTAGSGVGPASGDPAEVFNLRADAYLWSTSYSPGSARVPDASTKELPPRF